MPLYDVENKTPFLKAFYFLTRFGQEAVILFFVLSGFLIAGKFLKPNLDRKSLTKYTTDRLTRLWVVMIPAIVISVLVISKYPIETTFDKNCPTDLITILGNIFFLQDVLVEPLCSNEPLWSLTNEFWYYILFPALLIALMKGKLAKRVLAGVFFVGMVALFALNDQWDDRSVLLYTPIWLMGLLAWRTDVPKLNPYFAVILLAICMFFARAPIFESIFWIKDYLIGIATILLIVSVQGNQTFKFFSKKSVHKVGEFFANPSYSLYLIHYPIIHVCLVMIIQSKPDLLPLNPHLAASYLVLLGLIIASIIGAFIMYLLFEKHTMWIRNNVRKILKIK